MRKTGLDTFAKAVPDNVTSAIRKYQQRLGLRVLMSGFIS